MTANNILPLRDDNRVSAYLNIILNCNMIILCLNSSVCGPVIAGVMVIDLNTVGKRNIILDRNSFGNVAKRTDPAVIPYVSVWVNSCVRVILVRRQGLVIVVLF